MNFTDKPFGSFRNKALELFVKENHTKLLTDLWQETYDYIVIMEHEIYMYNKSLNRTWEFNSYADHLCHETNRWSGNIISTIKNYKWYIDENMEDKVKLSKNYIINAWLKWESYLQSLEFLYYIVLKTKEK